MRENPYQSPDAPLAVDNINQTQVLAPLMARFIAAALDGILSIVTVLPFFLIGYFFETETPSWLEIPLFENELLLSIFIIMYVIGTHTMLHGLLLHKYGQTIGKRIVGIQVVDYRTGKILPLVDVIGKRFSPQVIVNYIPVVGTILSFIDILFILGEERRCVHDYIAGTKVVDYIKPLEKYEQEAPLI